MRYKLNGSLTLQSSKHKCWPWRLSVLYRAVPCRSCIFLVLLPCSVNKTSTSGSCCHTHLNHVQCLRCLTKIFALFFILELSCTVYGQFGFLQTVQYFPRRIQIRMLYLEKKVSLHLVTTSKDLSGFAMMIYLEWHQLIRKQTIIVDRTFCTNSIVQSRNYWSYNNYWSFGSWMER